MGCLITLDKKTELIEITQNKTQPEKFNLCKGSLPLKKKRSFYGIFHNRQTPPGYGKKTFFRRVIFGI